MQHNMDVYAKFCSNVMHDSWAFQQKSSSSPHRRAHCNALQQPCTAKYYKCWNARMVFRMENVYFCLFDYNICYWWLSATPKQTAQPQWEKMGWRERKKDLMAFFIVYTAFRNRCVCVNLVIIVFFVLLPILSTFVVCVRLCAFSSSQPLADRW